MIEKEKEMVAADSLASENSPAEELLKKEIVASQVKGKVKWFNVDRGYGFIHRNDTNDDVFVHHTAITKYNPQHQLSSLAAGEIVEFDVAQGEKGLEAANVSGPNGEQVKGSRFATNFYAGRYRFRRSYNTRYYNRDYKKQPKAPKQQNEGPVDCTFIVDSESPDKAVQTDDKRDVTKSKKVEKYAKNRNRRPPLRRSNSLPSNMDRFMKNYHRRRYGPISAAFASFPVTYAGFKRRNRRKTEQEPKPDVNTVETQPMGNMNGQDEKAANSVDREVKTTRTKAVSENGTSEGKAIRKRRPKKRNSKKSSTDKSETSQKSGTVDANTNSTETAEVNTNAKGSSGTERGGGTAKGRGKWRRFGRRSGARSSSAEASTQTTSAKDDTKSGEGACGGGDGTDGKVQSAA